MEHNGLYLSLKTTLKLNAGALDFSPIVPRIFGSVSAACKVGCPKFRRTMAALTPQERRLVADTITQLFATCCDIANLPVSEAQLDRLRDIMSDS